MFEIAAPWALMGIIIPFVLWLFIKPSKVYFHAALPVPFFSKMVETIERGNLKDTKAFIVLSMVWILLIFALSGPRWVGPPLPIVQEGRNIMLVLDISGSMEMDDMVLNGRPATRLQVVKKTAENFVIERKSDRIGLILFGTHAYLQTPLTFDRHNVLLRIADATVGLAGKTTSIGDALGLAVKRLQDVPAKSRVIILLTDGANNSGVLAPRKAALMAKQDKIKVYTIGLGADPERFNDPFFNAQVSMDLDEDTLKEIATMTGGKYFRATDLSSLENIYNTINELETIAADTTTIRPQKEYYPWPLSLALGLLFLWFLRKIKVNPSVEGGK